MKTVLMTIVLLLFSTWGMAQRNILENKEYSGIVSQSCVRLQKGGCTMTTYNALTFEKDSVIIKVYSETECDIHDKSSTAQNLLGKYLYQIHKKKNSPNYYIRIQGYEFGLLEVYPEYLVKLNPDYTADFEQIFPLKQ